MKTYKEYRKARSRADLKPNEPMRSWKPEKKLVVLAKEGDDEKVIHFGDANMEDFTQHKDERRRDNYLKRAGGIRNSAGQLTKDDKFSANYWAMRYLWAYKGDRFTEGGSLLLAPNGKPSNLTPEQYKLVRTKAFKDWFGDWENDPANASKVVDENGEPLVVWHGTKKHFTIFGEGKNQNILPEYQEEYSYRKKTHYFHKSKTYSKTFGSKYGGHEKPFFLDIKKIELVDENEIENIGYYKNIYDYYVILKGLDGIYSQSGQYATLLNPHQIKLADGTNTTFDGSSPDIRFAEGGLVSLAEFTAKWRRMDHDIVNNDETKRIRDIMASRTRDRIEELRHEIHLLKTTDKYTGQMYTQIPRGKIETKITPNGIFPKDEVFTDNDGIKWKYEGKSGSGKTFYFEELISDDEILKRRLQKIKDKEDSLSHHETEYESIINGKYDDEYRELQIKHNKDLSEIRKDRLTYEFASPSTKHINKIRDALQNKLGGKSVNSLGKSRYLVLDDKNETKIRISDHESRSQQDQGRFYGENSDQFRDVIYKDEDINIVFGRNRYGDAMVSINDTPYYLHEYKIDNIKDVCDFVVGAVSLIVNMDTTDFAQGGQIQQMIDSGVVELKMYATKPEHAKIYGLRARNPLYVQRIYIQEDQRGKGIGKQVLEYIDRYAAEHKHDAIFGHIAQNSTPSIPAIKSMLNKYGYQTIDSNNDFWKMTDVYAEGGSVNPWAVCTDSVGREDKDKYESCVRQVKKKSGITKYLWGGIMHSETND